MASNLRVDSIVPATGSSVSIGTATGGVSIPGVLTYEDVTNVDSIGIVTARGGIRIGTGGTVGPVGSGIVTYYGDGSQLTGAGPTLSSGSNDRVITATGANALLGEANLTFSGSVLNINGTSDDTPLMIDTTSNNGAHLRFRKDGSNQHFVGAGGGFSLGDKEDLSLRGYDNILFATGNSSTERMRISSAGYVTKPQQPCFDATVTNGPVSGGNDIVFNVADLNIGTHYSTSNGRFTAPVTGQYFFYYGGIKNNNSNVCRLKLYKNGSSFVHNRELRLDDGDAYGENGSMSIICTLSATDYVTVRVTEGQAYGGSSGYTYFGGYLLS